jgi:hypothetical protein
VCDEREGRPEVSGEAGGSENMGRRIQKMFSIGFIELPLMTKSWPPFNN